jgi:hypothetical protein
LLPAKRASIRRIRAVLEKRTGTTRSQPNFVPFSFWRGRIRVYVERVLDGLRDVALVGVYFVTRRFPAGISRFRGRLNSRQAREARVVGFILSVRLYHCSGQLVILFGSSPLSSSLSQKCEPVGRKAQGVRQDKRCNSLCPCRCQGQVLRPGAAQSAVGVALH